MTIEKRKLTTIVFVDVVGYSSLMEKDETGTLAALRAHRSELIDPLIDKYGGRIVKTMGDGLLLEFSSVVDATKCSVGIQNGMLERNTGLQKVLRLRIGIHLGDIIVEDGDIFGDGVNIASRIEPLAYPDGIAISDDAYRQVRDRLDMSWQDGGEHKVKNIERTIPVLHWTASKKQEHQIGAEAIKLLPPTDRPSIAVLPFDNMSGDPEQEYFADGITEDIITELSKISEMMVISRNSTFTYKGKATKSQDVCNDLGVQYLVEGSVRKSGERVRITAQLIEGNSGGHIWAERYDRDLADIFAVQDDVTEKIVNALEVNLARNSPDQLARLETEIPEAYDCVLRGREQSRLFTEEGNLVARRLYEKAIELDPEYAAARAGLALIYLHDWFSGTVDALDIAHELALKANSLNPSQPIVYEALGNILLFKKDHAQAVTIAKRWLSIEPSNADAHSNLAAAMMMSGEHEQTIRLIDKAIRLNPFYPFYYILYKGVAYMGMEKYDKALVALKRSIAHNPESWLAHFYLAACFGLLDNGVSARSAYANVLKLVPELSITWVQKFLPFKRSCDLNRIIEGIRIAGYTE